MILHPIGLVYETKSTTYEDLLFDPYRLIQLVPIVRCPANLEFAHLVASKAPGPKIPPGMGCVGRRHQPSVVPVDGLFNCIGELTALFAVHTFVFVGVSELNASLVGQHLDGTHKIKMFDLADEGDGIATLAATETLVEAQFGVHIERRCLLIVKWTQTHAAPTHAFELQV